MESVSVSQQARLHTPLGWRVNTPMSFKLIFTAAKGSSAGDITLAQPVQPTASMQRVWRRNWQNATRIIRLYSYGTLTMNTAERVIVTVTTVKRRFATG